MLLMDCQLQTPAAKPEFRSTKPVIFQIPLANLINENSEFR